MVQIQGLKIAATMIALVLALSTMNTLAAASGLAIQLNSNGITTEQINSTVENTSDAPASGLGSQDPGFFGIAIGMGQTFQQLFALTTGFHAILKGWGVPPIIANSAQLMIDFTIVVAIYQIIRAVKF